MGSTKLLIWDLCPLRLADNIDQSLWALLAREDVCDRAAETCRLVPGHDSDLGWVCRTRVTVGAQYEEDPTVWFSGPLADP